MIAALALLVLAGLWVWVVTRRQGLPEPEPLAPPGLARPPGWLLAAMPVADRFDFPLGTEHGGLAYNAQPFGARDVSPMPHLGDDLNGCYGYDSDLGDPVYAVADGLVIRCFDAGGGWGGVVIVLHKLAGGRHAQSFYGHLGTIEAGLYHVVRRGQVIGTVGNAGGRYYAHLHFEMRAFTNPFLGAGYAQEAPGWLDPSKFLRENRGAPDDDLMPSPGLALKENERGGFR